MYFRELKNRCFHNIVIFAIRELRIIDVKYEEAQRNAATGYSRVIEDRINSQSELAQY